MSEIMLTTQGLPSSLADYNFVDHYRIPLMETPPVIDGFVDENEWRCSAGFDGFSHFAKLEERSIRAFVGATHTHLYFAFISELPAEGALTTDVKQNTVHLVWDDSIEVWINPEPEEDTGITYQVLVNPTGYRAYQTHPVGDIPRDRWYGWEGDYAIAHGFHDGYWHCEISVPIEKLSRKRLITDGQWAINITRNWKRPWKFSNIGNGEYSPNNWLRFSFHEHEAAAIQMKHLTDPTSGNVHLMLSAYNPGDLPVNLAALLYLKRDHMPEWSEDALWTLEPGAREELELKLADYITEHFTLFAVVREVDGPFHFSRHYAWGQPRKRRWETIVQQELEVDFQFAYYPYLNRLRICADISRLNDTAILEQINFIIREKDSHQVISTIYLTSADLFDQMGDLCVDMPPLDGEYEIVATCAGSGVPTAPVIKAFERHVYEWEHLGLGKSRKVYPPFTPIEMNGKTVRTVMKEYDIGELGLLDAARTLDQQRIAMKDILAGPMSYRVSCGGRDMAPEGAESQIIEDADDVVVLESTCRINGLQMTTVSTIEYDGLLRIDLTVDSSEPVQLDSLDLCIPISREVAELMHAMIDGGRSAITSQQLPAGEGVIWSASEQLTWNWPRNFCTYIYIGDARRGLCWFAENDHGWSWNKQTGNIDLLRSPDGTVTICVHLVNTPLIIASPRTLTFGIQAAPIKPKTEGWRHRWYTDNFSVLGCDQHWFALGICGSVYPAGRDMKLWEALNRANQLPYTDEEIEQFIDYGRAYFEPYGWETHTEEFVKFARKNLKNRAGSTMIFYYNRASSYVYDEWHTFCDEWGMLDFTDRNRRDPLEVKICPCESYLDYALYWYKKSFEIAGNKGIYIDNNYFTPDRNTMMTAAYHMGNGTIMPSSGVWGLRELAKRQFVLMNELGMDPITMTHTSTLQIMPISAFYTVQYDWEWKYSEGDVQDRFNRAYLQLITTGDIVGAWPIVLHDNGKKRFDYWTLRTYQAVCSVHEAIIDRYLWHEEPVPEHSPENPLYYQLRVPISQIAQQPDCEVYRYWDDRPQPVIASHPDLPTIIYARYGKEAIVVVASYASTDVECSLSIDSTALGFSSGCSAIDMETGCEEPINAGTINFRMKKHDMRQFKLGAL